MADGQTLVSVSLQRATRAQHAPVMRVHQPEAGFAVGAILFVLTMAGVAGGVLFSGTSQVLRTNIEITRDNTTKNDLLAAARTLSASSTLINSGLNVQPPAVLAFGSADSTRLPTGYASAGSAGTPTSVGVMTAGAGTRQLDPWNKYFIYCRWEGLTSPGTDPGIMLISAGPDGVLDTNCGSSSAQNDDKMESLSVGQLIDRANVWQYQNPGTPQVQFGIGANAVRATDAGDLTANTLTLAGALNAASLNLSAPLPITQGGTGAISAGAARTSLGSGTTGDSLFTATTAAGARGVLGSTTVGDSLFIAANAGAGRTALGATATGSSLFTATDPAAARTTLGATTVGDSVFTATDAAAGRTALGATTVGGGLFTAADAATARSVLGSGATGDSLFQTTTAASARSVLGAGATGESVFASANQTAALTALGLIGGSATLDIGITGTANTATYLADGGNILAGTVPIARGGTGAGTPATARAALGADNATNLTSGTLSWTRLPTSGVVAGAYNWGTVNAYGIVESAQNVVTNTLAQNNSGITITDTTAGVGTDGQIAFNVEGTTYGLMDYQGFLGLNTSAPQDRLHVRTGNIRIEGAAATDRLLRFTTGATSRRWEVGTDNTAEAGSNAGSDFVIRNYDDSGVLLGTPFTINRATGNVTFNGTITAGGFSGGGVGSAALSALTAATATNSINNTNYAQTWAWNTLAGASALTLSSTSTAAASNAQTILNIALSGANATSTQTTYGAQIANTHTGTASTNVGLSVSASGGTNNYGLLVPSGFTGIGTTTPRMLLDIAGTTFSDAYGVTGASNVGIALTDTAGSGTPRTWRIVNGHSAGGALEFEVSTTGGGNPVNTSMILLHTGNVGIGTTTPTSILSLGGNSARTFGMERHTTTNTAGNNLTIQAGGATSGSTNRDGGNLVLSGGISTGTGDSSVVLQAYQNASVVNIATLSGSNRTMIVGDYNVANNTSPATLLFGNFQNSGLGFPSIIFNTRATLIGLGQADSGMNANLRLGSIPFSSPWVSRSWDTFASQPINLSIDGGLSIGTLVAPTSGLLVQGNVGIGTTSPGSALDVQGTLRLSGSTSGYVGFAPAAAAGSTTYTLPSADGTSGQVLRTNGAGTLSWTTPSTTATSLPLSGLTAATATNSIDNTNYAQTWAWNTLAGASALTLSSNSTAAASNAQTILNIALSGANATSTQTTYGAQIANTHTGTASTNVGLSVSASGGSNNYAAIFGAGNVGIGTTTPSSILHVVGGNQKVLFSSTANSYGQMQLGNPGGKESSFSYISNMTALGNPPTSSSGNSFIWTQGVGLYSSLGSQYSISNAAYGAPSFLADSAGGVAIGAYAGTAQTTPPPANGLIVSGNVGIGTETPSSKLHVVAGNQKVLFSSTAYNYGQMQLGNPGGKESSFSYISNMTALGNPPTSSSGNSFIWTQGVGIYSSLGSQYSIGNAAYGGPSFLADSAGGVAIGAYAGTAQTTPPPANGLIVSGNVGIGTTSPGSALDVRGTLRLSGSTSGYVGLAPAAAAGSTTYTLPSADGTSGQLLSTNGSGTLSWTSSAASASTVPFSGLTAAAATNSINNADYAQTWAWNTLSSNSGLTLSSSSTAAAGNTQTLLNVALSGANATSTQTTYGAQIANTHTGTASTNVGLSVSASGGTNNYGLLVPSGNVGIGTTEPSSILSFSGNSAQTIGMERHTTADTAGNNLTIQAGGATSGATNKDGGDLVLSGGISTGTGDSDVVLQGYQNGLPYTLATFRGSSYGVALGVSTVSNGYATAMGRSTASGAFSTSFGNKVTASGDGSAAFGLATSANAPATNPIVSGTESFALFMGNHSGTTFAAANTVGFFGGNLVIDPAVPATQFTARGVIDVGAATTAIVLPRGTTAQQPSTPTGGMIRYNTSSTPSDTVEYYDAETSAWRTLAASGAAASSVVFSGLTAATATNSIDNTNYAQTWAWNTLAGASALTLSSNSTAAASNAQTILNIALSGANATSTQTTYGAQIANTHTGTASTNVGLSVSASGGTNNYGLLVPSGRVGIGTTDPTSMLTVLGQAFFSSGGVKIAGGGPASANFGLFTFTDATGNLNYTTSGSGTQNHVTFNQSGNIGIGTTAPSTILAFGGAADRVVGVEANGASGTAATLTLRGGAGGTTSGAGGAVTVTGGIPVAGNGGAATLSGAAGVGSNNTGGAASVTGGASVGSGTGAAANITGGAGGATGTGGAVNITSGAGGATSGGSGAVTIGSGTVTSGTPGSIIGQVGGTTYLTVQRPGASAPTTNTSSAILFGGTSAVTLPSGTTAQQPSTPTGGMIRYNTSSTPSDTVEYYDAETSAWRTLAASGAAASSVVFSGLTAATATNSIDNTNYAQTWAWNTLAGASALTLSSNSTAAASNAQTILNIALSGANATSTQTTYGAQIANTHTGTASTNVGLSVSASGGTNNYGLLVPSGNVGIGTTSPSSILSLGGNAARTIGMERHTTADTAGNSLTIQAGGATSGATNKDGGDLVLSGGISTGTGDSNVVLQGYQNGSLVTLGTFFGGTRSTALGNSTASGPNGTAGGASNANGQYSTAFGISTANSFVSTALGDSTASNTYATAIGYSTASGYATTAIGNKVTASGHGSMAFGLATSANTPATAPIVSGTESFALFMGNHSGTTFAAANTVGFFGGNLVIDPAVPATQFTARGVIDVGAATTAIVLPRGTDAQRPSSPAGGMLRYNSTATPNDKVEYYDAESAGWIQLGGSAVFSGLTAATATNSLDNTDYAQTWAWNTLAGASALTLSSTSTAAAGNAQTILNIALSGANATSTQTTYGAQIANTHTGTASTNVGLSVSASGGTNNYGLLVPSGSVGIGTTTPVSNLDVNGSINFAAGNIVGPFHLSTATNTTEAYYFGLSRNNQLTQRFNGMKVYNNANGLGGSAASRIGFYTDKSGFNASTEWMTITEDGNVGIGTTTPSSILSLGGNAARTFGMERHSTADTAGNNLTVSAGGATSGATDKSGGTLVLSGGTATGTGTSQIQFQTAAAGSTGTADSAPATRVTIDGRGNVGVGVTPTARLDVSGQIASRRYALSDGATVAVDWNNGNIQSVTLGGNRTFTFANGVDGARYILIITQDGAGSRTITWPGTVRWPGGTAAVLTTTASKTDYITFIYNGASGTYDAVGIVQNF